MVDPVGASFARVHEAERAEAYATLLSAFMDDAVERWLFPESAHYLTHFPEFLAAFGGRAFDAKTVWRLGAFSAVALWLPPGTEPDGQAIVTLLTEQVSPEKHADLYSVLEQMETAHPRYPHWYLPWFGVERTRHGQGLGGLLMARCLEIVDASHAPAYLETPSPRSIPFYERHGFEITGTAQAGTCPPITFMRRTAR